MRAGLIGAIALVILIAGSILGVASLLLLPLVGIIALIAVLIWMAGRRAEGKPPMQ